jgi:WD40 repeat protein
MYTLKGHTGEIVSLHFNAEGDKILTGSFDKTAMVIKEMKKKIFLFLILKILFWFFPIIQKRSGILEQDNVFIF